MRLPRFVEKLFKRNAAPEAAANLEPRDPALVTLISIIYSTQPKTFTGDAIYVTVTSAKSTPTKSSDDDTTDDTPTSTPTISTSSSKPTSSSSSSSTSSRSLTTTAPIFLSSSTSATIAIAATATTAPSATAAASSGMSGGAKAGLAFGLIILFALLGAAIFFFLKKRRQGHDAHQKLDDEKDFLALGRKPDALPSHATPSTASPFGATAAGGVFAPKLSEKSALPPLPVDEARRQRFSYEAAEAPRLSLRAVSQFEPSIMSSDLPAPSTGNSPNLSSNTTTAATGGAAAAAIAAAAGMSKPNLASDPNNPFGNHAEKFSSSPPQTIPLPPSPTGSTSRFSLEPLATDFPMPNSQPITPAQAASPKIPKGELAGGAAAIAAATAAAASNKPLVSPASSSGASATENVHRVQLDFNPSMEDELEIHAGQLVRIIHEYDDGWALCMRMDRSRQGVVPRTCLSKHTVKPRPQSPARPGPRGPPPALRPAGAAPFAQPPRPLSPANGPKSPGAASFAQSPRPLTPTGGRDRSNSSSVTFVAYNPSASQSPGSQLRQQESKGRSNSMSHVDSLSKKETAQPSKIPAPVGQVPTRKPVPNQSSP